MSRTLLRHESILAVLLVLALAVLAMQSDRFFTVDNLLNQGRLMAEVGLVALAMTFALFWLMRLSDRRRSSEL